MVKIDLVTGFLGSGKTTFIRRYARYLIDKGEKIAILENDYGAVNVDALLLGELGDAGCEIETVAGGCDHDCHVRRFRTKLIAMGMLGFDRVIVEPSGIYDVDEFFDVLHDEPLDRWYEIGNVITIADIHMMDVGAALSRETRYFLMSQTACAGSIILSHLNEKTETRQEEWIRFMNGALEEFRCSRQLTKADFLAKDWSQLNAEDFERISSCGYHSVDHIKLHLEDDNSFSSLYFLDLPLPLADLKEKSMKLFQDRAVGKVLRIKGFHMENVQWYELNASGADVNVSRCNAGQELFIVIGENLDQEAIRSRLGVTDEVWHNGNVYAGF